MSDRRNFNNAERIALFLAADGKCQNCGIDLDDTWEADHVYPYSKGGETDVLNGQALCRDCNRAKGANILSALPKHSPNDPFWNIDLRQWQIEAFERFQAQEKKDFMVVATPGAGKTLFSLRIAHYLLSSGEIDLIVVVAPTVHLKDQWAEKAHYIGIELDPEWVMGDIVGDFHGIAITYQSIASKHAMLRWLLGRYRVLVIFDEIHHAGDDKSWGQGIVDAFEHAKFRLAISGTPFRSDNSRIPFVTYTDDGVSVSDYNYGYARALDDDVCRAIIFPSYEGEMEWMSRNGQMMSATFDEKLNDTLESERLRTALNPNGEWMQEVIREAHAKLKECRDIGHKDAGGLVIAIDQKHAKNIAKKIKAITGETPVLAISDEPDASAQIERFAKGNQMWIVAVKMVSEGVDIPRLRVGIYATTTTTELFFRQATGRFVRVVPDVDEQTAYLYMPRHSELIQHALAIKEERDHILNMDDDPKPPKDPCDPTIEDCDPPPPPPSLFMPIAAVAEAHDSLLDGEEITQFEKAQALEVKRQMGAVLKSIPIETIALMMRIMKQQGKDPQEEINRAKVRQQASEPLHKKRGRLRRQVQGIAAKYTGMRGWDYWHIHNIWQNPPHNGSKQENADIAELEAKKEWLLKLIEDYKHNGR